MPEKKFNQGHCKYRTADYPDIPRCTPAFFYINSNWRLSRGTARCVDIPRLMKICIITDSRDRLSILPFNETQKEMEEEYWIPDLSLYVNSISFLSFSLFLFSFQFATTSMSRNGFQVLLSIVIRISTNTVSSSVVVFTRYFIIFEKKERTCRASEFASLEIATFSSY